MLVSKACERCGKAFNSQPSNKRKFCGMKCAALHKKGRPLSHGMSYSRLYRIWCDMKNRCGNPSVGSFQYYGGRGISVCEEWSEHYEAFQSWAEASGYQDDLEIDRIDSNGDYEPSNCRWATRNQQMRNTRKRRDAKTSLFKGVSKNSRTGKWTAQGHRHGKPVRIGLFSSEEDAARAYDEWARKNYGEFSVLNFKEEKGVNSFAQEK